MPIHKWMDARPNKIHIYPHPSRVNGSLFRASDKDYPMGVLCGLTAVPEEVAIRIINDPQLVHELHPMSELLGTRLDLDQMMSLEKNWHGIHYTLTGSPWGGDEPLNFLMAGGVSAGSEHVGYGAARVLLPDAVSRLDLALRSKTDEWFRQHFDLEGFRNGDIYHMGEWSDLLDDFEEEYGYGGMFRVMKAFVNRAAQRGHALVIVME